ncbi:hypothetical protein ANOBCDAF_01980 [Pleomorphomonas sp. T1.2MG-36]|nr:hypothetical protein ANOBCDAF_01980 [Pleomorphomonas sp. T1.2MG-36]
MDTMVSKKNPKRSKAAFRVLALTNVWRLRCPAWR